MEWQQGGFCITAERERISVDTVHRLRSSEVHWSKVFRAKPWNGHSTIRCVSLHGGDQIGLSGVIAGRATIAHLGSVACARRIPRVRVVRMAHEVRNEPFGTVAAAPLDTVHW
jgi:hypothetical protein